MIKRFAALLLLVALTGMLVAGSADAHRRRGQKQNKKQAVGVSNVTIDFQDREPTIPLPILWEDEDDSFVGKITKVKGCDGRQVVEINRAGGGVIGTTEASTNGDYTISIEDPGSDTYFAKVTGFPKKNTHHVCTRGTSSLLTVEEAGQDGL